MKVSFNPNEKKSNPQREAMETFGKMHYIEQFGSIEQDNVGFYFKNKKIGGKFFRMTVPSLTEAIKSAYNHIRKYESVYL